MVGQGALGWFHPDGCEPERDDLHLLQIGDVLFVDLVMNHEIIGDFGEGLGVVEAAEIFQMLGEVVDWSDILTHGDTLSLAEEVERAALSSFGRWRGLALLHASVKWMLY